MIARCTFPIPLGAEVVVAIRGNLDFGTIRAAEGMESPAFAKASARSPRRSAVR